MTKTVKWILIGVAVAVALIVAQLEERPRTEEPGVVRTYLFCGHSRPAAVAALLAGNGEAILVRRGWAEAVYI